MLPSGDFLTDDLSCDGYRKTDRHDNGDLETWRGILSFYFLSCFTATFISKHASVSAGHVHAALFQNKGPSVRGFREQKYFVSLEVNIVFQGQTIVTEVDAEKKRLTLICRGNNFSLFVTPASRNWRDRIHIIILSNGIMTQMQRNDAKCLLESSPSSFLLWPPPPHSSPNT